MQWLIDYWWIVLLVLIGIIVNAVKALSRVDKKTFLEDKPELPPHRDFNAQWDEDEDDWPQQDRKK
ncbi:YpfN family protein [Xenorhabdus kozodoii]|uniref:Membrane protein n=1 Tax=Xenorhabdus kozodoii TaxID=351676 RepID=A0A2D0LI12_9GAMM|nr:YpfN family protein [Xenorhabdus kozodoii]PHM75240.1 membrane protein [Xenorhabdus kozodoii]